jgi:hypothetical protein
MIATNFVSLHVRRWLLLLCITTVLQWVAVVLAPQLMYACHGPHAGALILTAIPVLWSLVLLTIYRGKTERAIAYGAFVLSAAVLLAIHLHTVTQ